MIPSGGGGGGVAKSACEGIVGELAISSRVECSGVVRVQPYVFCKSWVWLPL